MKYKLSVIPKISNFAKSATDVKKEILESVGLKETDMSSIKSFKSKGDGYTAIVDCNRVPGFKKGEDSQFKLISQVKDSHSEKGYDTLKEAQDAEKEIKNFESTSESISGDWIYELLNNKIEEESQELTLIHESIDNLTEAVNLDWELDYSIDKINSSDLKKLTDYLIKKKYLLIANDELTSNFIYYNQVSLVSKIDSQVFIYSLKGSELSPDFEKVLSSIKGLSKSVNFDSKKLLKSFSLSNADSRILKVRFDPMVVKIPNLNKFLDTFKMLPIVSEVKLLEDTVELKLNTERSLVGVSEIINGALAKVACNVTYQISE